MMRLPKSPQKLQSTPAQARAMSAALLWPESPPIFSPEPRTDVSLFTWPESVLVFPSEPQPAVSVFTSPESLTVVSSKPRTASMYLLTSPFPSGSQGQNTSSRLSPAHSSRFSSTFSESWGLTSPLLWWCQNNQGLHGVSVPYPVAVKNGISWPTGLERNDVYFPKGIPGASKRGSHKTYSTHALKANAMFSAISRMSECNSMASCLRRKPKSFSSNSVNPPFIMSTATRFWVVRSMNCTSRKPRLVSLNEKKERRFHHKSSIRVYILNGERTRHHWLATFKTKNTCDGKFRTLRVRQFWVYPPTIEESGARSGYLGLGI